MLLVHAGHEPASQQQAAQRPGINRTTMVALLNSPEGKGLVARYPRADDRRRNCGIATYAELSDMYSAELVRSKHSRHKNRQLRPRCVKADRPVVTLGDSHHDGPA
jgi:hypothetical protein